MQPAVSVRGVTKIYQEGSQQVPVLHGIDLDVMPGEFVLMMGPSGSGKTTLLSIMGCILRATAGSIRIAGTEVSQLTEEELPNTRLKNIGFIFQGFNLFPTLSVGENVELSLDLKGMRGAPMRTEARRLLAQVEMDHKYDSFPADLSGGQKQRVAVARALAGSPGASSRRRTDRCPRFALWPQRYDDPFSVGARSRARGRSRHARPSCARVCRSHHPHGGRAYRPNADRSGCTYRT